jgi:hypothetical protein
MITEEDVLDALRTVQDPELGQDLVSLDMIRDLRIEGDRVSFTVALTTPACPLGMEFQERCEEAGPSAARCAGRGDHHHRMSAPTLSSRRENLRDEPTTSTHNRR